MDDLKNTNLCEIAKQAGELIAYQKILRRINEMMKEYAGYPTARTILTELGDYTYHLSDSVKQ